MRRHSRTIAAAALIAWCIYGATIALAGAEEFIQPRLDQGRTVRLAANATYHLDAPLRIGSRAQLVGAGFTTTLAYDGEGDTAIYLGDVDSAAYAYTLRDVAIVGGGVMVLRCSDLCTIERVWVGRAGGAGITVAGHGDRQVINRVVVRECDVGIHIRSARANNGLVLRDCSITANRGTGLVVESVDWSSAHVKGLRVEGCTIQGNNTAAVVGTGSEVVLRGAVASPVFVGSWLELTGGAACLRIEPSEPLADPNVLGRMGVRSPSDVHVRESSLHPVNPLRASIEVVAMEGSAGSLRITDSDLRMPIRAAAGVPAIVQAGGRTQAVVPMVKGDEHESD